MPVTPMELFLLLVLVVLWLVVRSRDLKRQRSKETGLRDLLGTIEIRLRLLETAQAKTAVQQRDSATAPESAPTGDIFHPRGDARRGASGPPAYAAPSNAVPDTPASQRPLEVGDTGVHPISATSAEAPAPRILTTFSERTVEDARQDEASARHAVSLEERLGANWLNKLGIVILVFGVAFFLAYQLKNLGALGKVMVGYAVSLTLLLGNLVLERRNQYRTIARAGIGGGWALLFFTTYAMYHVQATRVLDSQAVDLVLLFIVATGMVWHSLRYKSQVVTGLAFLLAFSTVSISQVDVYSLIASAVLAVGLVYVTSQEHWAELELAGVIAVYGSHFYWLYRVLQPHGGPGHQFPEFYASAGLIILYWAVFRVAYVCRMPRDHREDLLTSFTAVLNSAGLLGLLKYQSSHPEWAFWALLALGAVEMLLALYVRHRRRSAFIVLSCIATGLLLAAVPFRYHGAHWALLWILEAEVLFVCGVRMREVVFRRLGLLCGFVAAFQLFAVELASVSAQRVLHPIGGRYWGAVLAFAVAAAAYWCNGEAAVRRWPDIAVEQIDNALLRTTSYLGLAAAATGLWIYFPDAETVLAWMALVIVLGVAADKLDSGDLSLQTDILAAGVLLRVMVVNLDATGHWGWLTQRAISVGIVSLLFYAAAWRKKGALDLSPAYIAPAYTWAGSLLVALLLWYELRPVGVAMGWAVLGLVLLEIGILRQREYLRHQAFLLLAASFARIFFVNLNVASNGHLLGPRVYTVTPLVAGFFWAYERLRENRSPARFERIAADIACCFGTIALAALVYFEIMPEWVVIAWAILVFLLLGVALLLNRRLFLAQGLVLAVAVFARALLFNLASATLLQGPVWQRRSVCIGLATAVLFLALPLAFRLRQLDRAASTPRRWVAWGELVVARPEQLLFFAPLLLLTITLAHEMRAGMITVTWSALGVAVFLLALLVRERSYRLAGLGLLLLGVAKILFIDIWNLAPTDRYITLIVVGVALLLVSFLYTRYREVILKFL
jgi:uncharacterized membrane protein